MGHRPLLFINLYLTFLALDDPWDELLLLVILLLLLTRHTNLPEVILSVVGDAGVPFGLVLVGIRFDASDDLVQSLVRLSELNEEDLEALTCVFIFLLKHSYLSYHILADELVEDFLNLLFSAEIHCVTDAKIDRHFESFWKRFKVRRLLK